MGKVAAKYSIGNSSQSARLRLLMFIRRFIGLWAIFVQVPKSLIFQVKSFLGNFYGHLAIFLLSHCSCCSDKLDSFLITYVGRCTNSNIIKTMATTDETLCSKACETEGPSCTWFTYDRGSTLCQLMSNCVNIDVIACPNCVSGQNGCTSQPVPVCWVTGNNYWWYVTNTGK